MEQVILMVYFCLAMYYFVTGIYVLNKDIKSITNRLFFLLLLSAGFWAMGYAFLYNASNKNIGNHWRIIAAFGWCFFYSFMLDFAISINKNAKNTYSKVRLLLYIIPSFFVIIHLRYSASDVLFKFNNGWREEYPTDIYRILFDLYYLIYSSAAVFVIYRWGKNSKLIREKKQSKIIVITAIATIITGIITVETMPKLGVKTIPLSVLTLSIGMIGICYAIIQYKMMTITPEYMSDYIFKNVKNSIFFTETDLRIVNVNDNAIKMTGYDLKDIKKIHLNELIDEGTFRFSRLLQDKTVRNAEVNLITREGSKIQCVLFGTVIYDDYGDVLGIAIIMEDVSEQRKAQEMLENYNWELENKVTERTIKLEKANEILSKEIFDRIAAEEKIMYMGYNDELTGLPNRRYFNEYINEEIKRLENKDECFSVMFLDLDDFKFINDTYGHKGGDNLLKQIALRMKCIISEKELIARIGGDEFLILQPSLSREESEDSLLGLAEKIMSIFNEPFLINEKETFISTSIGISQYPVDGDNAESLIANADISMYEAKKSNKNNIKICTAEIKSRMMEKTNLRNSLYTALDKEELYVYYQPQVDINSDKILGFEALLRWKINGDHFIPPVDFIPIAEETGLIVPIGYWVINDACVALKNFHDIGFEGLCMAINLSANQLMENNFVEKVTNIIKLNGLDPAYIEFEITERITLKGQVEIKKKLHDLKKIGVRISIDDFGTDYSSFMNLKTLPIDKIKIAMEFIQGLNENIKDDTIVSSIIELSKKLGLEVIAEGVETNDQLKYVKSNNCSEVQGYLFYRPMPYCEMEKILLNQKSNKE